MTTPKPKPRKPIAKPSPALSRADLEEDRAAVRTAGASKPVKRKPAKRTVHVVGHTRGMPTGPKMSGSPKLLAALRKLGM